MKTIAENLQTLLDNKKAIKEALESKGKAPSDTFSTYPDLIKELDNEEQVSYVLSNADGSKKIYAQLSDKAPVKLTATPNDIRENTVAITNDGVTEGTKEIPAYHTTQGYQLIPANSEFKISKFPKEDLYDYTKLQAMTMPYNTSLNDSVAVDRAVIEEQVYNAGSTEAVSNVTKDDASKSILLGIVNGDTPAIIRYFTYKEVP